MKKLFSLLALLAMIAPLSLSAGCDTGAENGTLNEGVGEGELGGEIGETEIAEDEIVE